MYLKQRNSKQQNQNIREGESEAMQKQEEFYTSKSLPI